MVRLNQGESSDWRREVCEWEGTEWTGEFKCVCEVIGESSMLRLMCNCHVSSTVNVRML